MKSLIKIFILITAIVAAMLASAQDVKVSITPDTNAIRIGEHFNAKLTVQIPIGTHLKYPAIKDTLTSHVEVVAFSKIDTTYNEDKTQLNLSAILTATSFDSGYWAVPPIKFINADDSSKVYETEAFLITVNTVDVDTTKAIRVIKQPYGVPISWQEMLPYIIGGVAIILISIIIYILYKKRKNRPVFVAPPAPQKLPYEVAMETLAVIEEQKLWQNGKVKEYHSAVNDCIRIYFEAVFNIPALEQTTDEIVHSLKRKTLSRELLTKVEEMFRLSDLVKFAKENPLPNENELCITYAREIVELTKPQEPLEPKKDDVG